MKSFYEFQQQMLAEQMPQQQMQPQQGQQPQGQQPQQQPQQGQQPQQQPQQGQQPQQQKIDPNIANIKKSVGALASNPTYKQFAAQINQLLAQFGG